MQVVVVPVADRPECAKALKSACDPGNRVDVSVRGCPVRPHSDSKANIPVLMLHT